MTRIALVGPGAVGGVVATWLAQTKRYELTLCARSPLDGLTVETPSGVITARPPVLTDPAQAEPVEWVLVATKAYDVAGTAMWLQGLAARGAPVAILQNGVEHRERFAPYLPSAQIVPVMVDIPAERSAPGHIRQRGAGKMLVQDNAPGREFASFFKGTAINVATTPDLKSAVWRKLCINSSGVINALLLQPSGALRDEQLGELLRLMVEECMAVGRAEGAVFETGLADAILQGQRTAPPDSMNSIHADRAAGRAMEVDARNGVIVRLGRKHGIPTPCNQMAIALLEAMVRGERRA